MNNIKVLTTLLKDTFEEETWLQRQQANLFVNLIQMRVKEWNRIVDEVAIDAARAVSYDAVDIVNVLESRIEQHGFYSELRNPEGKNVAEYADKILVSCVKNSSRVRGVLAYFFREKIEFLKSSRMRDGVELESGRMEP